MLTHFNYWLTGHGWAEVFFTNDQQEIRFEFSYLSDPLTDLIDSLLKLITGSRNESNVDFFDEPGHYRLTLTIVENINVRLELRNWAESEGIADIAKGLEASKLLFELTDTLNNVCSVVYAGILDLKNRHTEVEYFEQWLNYPFPFDKFKLLEQEVSKRY
jgi:hypothetical protein